MLIARPNTGIISPGSSQKKHEKVLDIMPEMIYIITWYGKATEHKREQDKMQLISKSMLYLISRLTPVLPPRNVLFFPAGQMGHFLF
jgi:hypothetical protein